MRFWKAFISWLSIPFTSNGRNLIQWLITGDVFTSNDSSGSLPQISWSQDGEDLLFADLFPRSGFYIDIGAHHPDRYSVTKKLYDMGWSGVNVDFTSDFQTVFDDRRPRDTNIKALVGTGRFANFYRFQEGTLSTLSESRARQLEKIGWKILAVEVVAVEPLDAMLLSRGITPCKIDLLSIDVEGEELGVLQTLDWEAWEVERCLVEIVEPAFRVSQHPVAQFLMSRGLKLTRVWGRSCLFERNFQPDELDRDK